MYKYEKGIICRWEERVVGWGGVEVHGVFD